MDFRILGPLEVVDERGPVEITGANTRAVLAALLLDADRSVPPASLIEIVWGEVPPGSAPAMLRNAVSQLRRQLGDAIETTPAGYRFRLGRHTLDTQTFAELVATGRVAQRSGDVARASAELGSALGLWRGRPLDGVGRNGEFELRTNELEELRRAAVLDRIDADLQLGGSESTIVAETHRLVEEDPYNERLRAQLMTALYRVGRQADALAAYQDARRALSSDLGLEPSEGLRELERRILQHDPQLDRPGDEPARRRRPWRLVAAAMLPIAVVAGVVVVTSRDAGVAVASVPGSSLAILDAGNGHIISTTALGGTATALAANDRGSWVATRNRTLVRVTRDGKLAETFGVGFAPVDVAVHRDTVWAVSRSYLGRVARLRAGEVTTYAVASRKARAGQQGRELHVTADAAGAWVGDGDNGIYRLDGTVARLVASAPDGLGSQHGGPLVTGSGSVWISDASHDGVITRLDPVTAGEVASITLPLNSESNGPAAFGDDALWTVSRGETTLWRVDAEENTISQTVRVGVGTVGLAYGAGALWAVNEIKRTLLRIDPRQAAVTGTWRFSRAPVGVAAHGDRVWVAFS